MLHRKDLSQKSTQSMENFVRYIIRASFSQERMNYIREKSKVIYKSKDVTNTRRFDAVDFISSLASHIPNMVNRWSGTMATTAMYAGAEGKKIILTGQTLLCKMTGIKRVAINPGQGLLKKYMKLTP